MRIGKISSIEKNLEISKFSNLDDSENFKFGKFEENSILKFPKIFIEIFFLNCRFGKLRKCPICEIP